MNRQTPDNQSSADSLKAEEYQFTPTRFRFVPFISIILLVMVFISQAIQWYSQAVTLPRFCEDPGQAIHYLEEIVTKRTPAREQSRRPYIIAAKLIYLIPQKSDEADPDYIHRVRRELNQRCMR